MKDKLKNNHNMLFRLFLSTLYISAFTFGGGYVIVSLMKKKFVDDYHWIDENEMLDFVAIAQSAPGPIAINGAIVVGYRLAGILGIGITILATVIPPFVIISVISFFYNAFRDNFISIFNFIIFHSFSFFLKDYIINFNICKINLTKIFKN